MALGRQDEIPALKAHRAVLGPDRSTGTPEREPQCSGGDQPGRPVGKGS